MILEEKIQRSETRIFKAVFPDRPIITIPCLAVRLCILWTVAFITDTRFSRKKVVTVSSDRVDFTKPIPDGTIIELVGNTDWPDFKI